MLKIFIDSCEWIEKSEYSPKFAHKEFQVYR
jgi:hypothetical protein